MRRLYRATRRERDAERCELCAVPLATDHDHLWELRAHRVRCVCRGCALIIPTSERAGYRRVPRRFARLDVDATHWLARFGVPVGIAALFRHADGPAVLGYPGPVGLVESELDTSVWDELRAALPAAAALEPEVEAIVWSSLPDGGAWLTGIDVVFRMITELRRSWVGMSGGPEAPAAIARVLAELAGGAA